MVIHLTTRVEKHRKETPVGQCGIDSGKLEFNLKLLDQASSSIKLLKLEVLYTRKKNRQLTAR